jgi:hypothetical protein
MSTLGYSFIQENNIKKKIKKLPQGLSGQTQPSSSPESITEKVQHVHQQMSSQSVDSDDDEDDNQEYNVIPTREVEPSIGPSEFLYSQSSPVESSPPMQSTVGVPHNMQTHLLKRLNYMIHLLEEQQEQKTEHVMEEVILYCFLGIFIIYTIDSFVHVGKYTR